RLTPPCSGRQTLSEQVLALLSALAARRLRAAEELGQIRVALALGVLDIGLEAQHIAQRSLSEPNEVVILVLSPGDIAGLLSHGSLPPRWVGLSTGVYPRAVPGTPRGSHSELSGHRLA